MKFAHIKPGVAAKYLPIYYPRTLRSRSKTIISSLWMETFQLPLDPQFTFSLNSHPLYLRTALELYWKKGKRGTLEILIKLCNHKCCMAITTVRAALLRSTHSHLGVLVSFSVVSLKTPTLLGTDSWNSLPVYGQESSFTWNCRSLKELHGH